MSKFCAECREKYHWALDTKMAPPPIKLASVGSVRQELRDGIESRKHRADEHYRVIREYIAWLKDYCENNHQPGNETQDPPVV